MGVPMKATRSRRGRTSAPLPTAVLVRLAQAIARDGESRVVATTQLTKFTIARCLAGLPVSTETADTVGRYLDAEGAAYVG